jgi:hypothetical protein
VQTLLNLFFWIVVIYIAHIFVCMNDHLFVQEFFLSLTLTRFIKAIASQEPLHTLPTMQIEKLTIVSRRFFYYYQNSQIWNIKESFLMTNIGCLCAKHVATIIENYMLWMPYMDKFHEDTHVAYGVKWYLIKQYMCWFHIFTKYFYNIYSLICCRKFHRSTQKIF